jgi:hypothetical protein
MTQTHRRTLFCDRASLSSQCSNFSPPFPTPRSDVTLSPLSSSLDAVAFHTRTWQVGLGSNNIEQLGSWSPAL